MLTCYILKFIKHSKKYIKQMYNLIKNWKANILGPQQEILYFHTSDFSHIFFSDHSFFFPPSPIQPLSWFLWQFLTFLYTVTAYACIPKYMFLFCLFLNFIFLFLPSILFEKIVPFVLHSCSWFLLYSIPFYKYITVYPFYCC